MKRFQFRLQTVLKLRERAEEKRKQQLAEVLALRLQQADRQARLEAQLAQHRQRQRELTASGAMDMEAVIGHRQFATAVDFRIRRTREAIRVIDEEAARRRAALAQATSDR